MIKITEHQQDILNNMEKGYKHKIYSSLCDGKGRAVYYKNPNKPRIIYAYGNIRPVSLESLIRKELVEKTEDGWWINKQ